MRLTLGQFRQGMGPQAIGVCQGDVPTIAAYVNRAQQILINAGGESGFWGGWQKVAFQVSRCNPYITLPRQFARAINMDVCRFPIRIQNEFYEFLEAGIGLQGPTRNDWEGLGRSRDWCGALEGYERGTWPTMVHLWDKNQTLRVYITDARDVNSRILIGPAKDQNGNYIYTQDGNNPVQGFYMNFTQPFTDNGFIVTDIGGIQKDATYGDVLLYQVDATTGQQVLLSRYAPNETTPGYRRYYINRLPCACPPCIPVNPCLTPLPAEHYVPVTAMVKLEFIPANLDTDFLIIGNEPALIEEIKAIRYADQDAPNSPALQAKSHSAAIRLLNQELTHYLGELRPAINFAPFGTARLRRPLWAVRNG